MTTQPRKIAFVCAFTHGNSGMYSVDLAAREVLDGLGCAGDLLNGFAPHRFGELTYGAFTSVDDLQDYSDIVFWGDFHNNPVYARGYAKRRVKMGLSPDIDHGLAFWRETHLRLHEALAPETRVHLLGGCLLGLESAAGDPALLADLRGLFARATTIAPRDMYSLQAVRRVFPDLDHPGLGQGLDPAFLLSARRDPARADSDYFVYFYHRSKLGPSWLSMQRLARRVGLKARRVDWLNRGAKRLDPAKFEADMALIAGARFALTDTYHMGVNALRLGVPAICIGREGQAFIDPVSDFKKLAMLSTMGLERFHVSAGPRDRLRHLLPAIEAQVGDIARDWSFSEESRAVDAHVADFRANVREALGGE